MVPTPSRRHMPRTAASSSRSSVRNSSPMNNKTSRTHLVSLAADAAAKYPALALECARLFCRKSAHVSQPVDWVPAKYSSNRFSRVHEAFVGCFISFAPAFVSNCTSQRSEDKFCRLPRIPRLGLHSSMSRSASSPSFCLTDPATLGVGAGVAIRQPSSVVRWP